jgi:hypothetical protein
LRAAGVALAAAAGRLAGRLTTEQQQAEASAGTQNGSPQSSGPAAATGKGWLAGLTERMVGAPMGSWRDVADDLALTAKELEAAGDLLAACRVGKKSPR